MHRQNLSPLPSPYQAKEDNSSSRTITKITNTESTHVPKMRSHDDTKTKANPGPQISLKREETKVQPMMTKKEKMKKY